MTFVEMIEIVLKEAQKPLSSEEIWDYALSKGYDKKIRTQGKTPWATIGARIYVDMKENPQTIFGITEERPKKFFLKNETHITKAKKDTIALPSKQAGYKEIDLHPFLSYYTYSYMRVYTKTINHAKSDRKKFGEWVHPDIVGCHFALEEWKPEVVDFGSLIGSIAIKLFSFEMKREINFGNLRESFFQTVSNSSWAHESYLVAAKIQKDEDFMDELKRLSSSFGIGIIELDVENPDSSQILLPSKTREYLDWETINKLTMNSDFKDFILRIKTDIQSKEIRKEKYDKILTPEQLSKLIKKSS